MNPVEALLVALAAALPEIISSLGTFAIILLFFTDFWSHVGLGLRRLLGGTKLERLKFEERRLDVESRKVEALEKIADRGIAREGGDGDDLSQQIDALAEEPVVAELRESAATARAR